MPSLKLSEARARADLLQVSATRVDLDLTNPVSTFGSRTTIDFHCRQSGQQTFVDFKGSELVRASLNGVELDVASWQDGRLPLSDLREENVLVVEGVMAFSGDGEGLHRHVDPADNQTYLYAMSFLDAAPRWFACFDQPDLKSRYTFQVQAPEDWTVLGNGRYTQTAPASWRMDETQPLSTYYVTLVAGPYVSVRDDHDGILLGIHVRASLAEFLTAEAADILTVTKQSFDYFHQIFGVRYPFGEYHQAFVPDFNAGAMENPGCVTLRDSYIFRSAATKAERGSRACTIAHEMAHMWFGDLVTMTWWDDLWLNESFAEYLAHRACAVATDYPMWTDFGIVRKDWGSVADQSPSSHPVAGNGSADAQAALADFDGISYAKGAAVLKQLVAYLGDQVFLTGLRGYFDRHRFGNAEFADLMAAWTEAGAQGLPSWADSWLRRAGMDTLSVEREADGNWLIRTPPTLRDGHRPHALQVAAIDRAGSETARTAVFLTGDRVRVELDAPLLVPDAADETWARVRFGPAGWTNLPPVARIADPHTRVVIYNSIRDGVRNTELDPSTALSLLLAQVGAEAEDRIVAELLQYSMHQLAGPYSAPARRAARRQVIASTAARVLTEASASSDRQLVAFRAVLASSDDTGLLNRWLDGHGLPAGIVMDPELRWAAVVRLATLGAPAELIDQTLQADRSAAGHVHAARARASLPQPESKAAAFQLLMEPSSCSAYELYATAQGFFLPEQAELTAPFVQQYFERINDTATFRSGWSLATMVLYSFPLAASERGTLELATGTLAADGLHPGVRRSLVDATDLLRRAVSSQTSYPG